MIKNPYVLFFSFPNGFEPKILKNPFVHKLPMTPNYSFNNTLWYILPLCNMLSISIFVWCLAFMPLFSDLEFFLFLWTKELLNWLAHCRFLDPSLRVAWWLKGLAFKSLILPLFIFDYTNPWVFLKFGVDLRLGWFLSNDDWVLIRGSWWPPSPRLL